MEEREELLGKIFEAIYQAPTEKSKSLVWDIVANRSLESYEKASLICDELGIERRMNRAAIRLVLNEWQP